jgi:hypothetical protein
MRGAKIAIDREENDKCITLVKNLVRELTNVQTVIGKFVWMMIVTGCRHVANVAKAKTPNMSR